MNLEAALNAFRAEFLEKFPAEKAATMQRATDAITQKFQSQPFYKIGNLTADFKLSNVIACPQDPSYQRLKQKRVLRSHLNRNLCL